MLAWEKVIERKVARIVRPRLEKAYWQGRLRPKGNQSLTKWITKNARAAGEQDSSTQKKKQVMRTNALTASDTAKSR